MNSQLTVASPGSPTHTPVVWNVWHGTVCADALGLSAAAVGVVTSVSYVCDSVCFPLGGIISDAYGRKCALPQPPITPRTT